MSHRLIIREEAEEDLSEAARWYEAERSDWGREFIREAREMIAVIADRPLSFPIIDLRIRRALMRRFPYCIYFVADSNTVIVIAVKHAKQHPDRWRNRLN